jgi:hypothetical protein
VKDFALISLLGASAYVSITSHLDAEQVDLEELHQLSSPSNFQVWHF